jgi:acyl-coenzyme A synthetase/AMP-(fatty) acid ligase
VPREVLLAAELPKTATGKILRRDVREAASRGTLPPE